MHHPPFDTGVWWMMDCVGLPDEHRQAFESVIRRNPQVRQVVSGHIHRPVQTTWGPTMIRVAPSTAHQAGLDLRPGGPMRLTAEPPMLTLLDWTDERVLMHTAAFAGRAVHRHLVGDDGPWTGQAAAAGQAARPEGGCLHLTPVT
jgi:hypothetical protein